MSDYSLSQEALMPSEVYDAVVQEINRDGTELLAAVEASDVFDNTEQGQYNEDQKGFVAWNHPQQYEYSEGAPQMLYQPPVPVIPPQIPSNVDYAGQLDFDILITSHTANRNSWIYSQMLNKVFINMQNILPVDVKRNVTSGSGDLYLRATLLYSLPQYAQELVERCSTHIDPRLISNRDTEPQIIRHVLRCTNPGSVYMGDTNRKEHLSVVTVLPQPQAGVETVRVNYQFMCKNSCPSGMNRRAVDVIFTLEDAMRNVLGRRKLSVRVCSCPKRDKEKEEKEYSDCLQQQHPPAHGRKRKMGRGVSNTRNNAPVSDTVPVSVNADDNEVYEVSYKVVGKATLMASLAVARNGMVTDVHYNKFDEEKEVIAKECINKLNGIIKNFTNPATTDSKN